VPPPDVAVAVLTHSECAGQPRAGGAAAAALTQAAAANTATTPPRIIFIRSPPMQFE
jgi:hypothetical protein